MVKLTRNISWLESATWSNSQLRAKQYEFLRAHVKHTLISRETHDASKSIPRSAFFSCYQVMSPSGKERKGRRKGGGREAHEKVEWREEGKIWRCTIRYYGHDNVNGIASKAPTQRQLTLLMPSLIHGAHRTAGGRRPASCAARHISSCLCFRQLFWFVLDAPSLWNGTMPIISR